MNHGINLELEKKHQSEEDWVFGALSQKCIAEIPNDERQSYLPIGEVQRGVEDFTDCATRGPINLLETKFTWLVANNIIKKEHIDWLYENGYIINEHFTASDRFIAILSGTTRQGNSLIAPLKAIHEYGLIPKAMLPARSDMTFNEYHDPQSVTPAMIALGREFLRRFNINYERVYETDFEVLLNEDMIDVAGYAWPKPINGVYPRTENQINHAFLVFKNPKYNIFDNYLDSDNDFIKVLAPDYDLLDYGYRLIISENIKKQDNWLIDLIKRFIKVLCNI